jgi:hypothetical protein
MVNGYFPAKTAWNLLPGGTGKKRHFGRPLFPPRSLIPLIRLGFLNWHGVCTVTGRA